MLLLSPETAPHTQSTPSTPTTSLVCSPNDPLLAPSLETLSLEANPQLFTLHPAMHASCNAHGLLQVSRKATEVTQLSNTQKATEKI